MMLFKVQPIFLFGTKHVKTPTTTAGFKLIFVFFFSDLRTLATAPDLYPTFVDLQCVPSILGLLSHENSDVSVAVVDLIQELTDIDTLNESEEGKI